MFEGIMIILFFGYIGLRLVLYFTELIIASRYDSCVLQIERQLQMHPSSRLARRRPPIDVFIHTDNDAQFITSCLDSLRKTRYKNLRIFVVDNCSKDDTKSVVRHYQKAHPAINLRLVANKIRRTRKQSLSLAIKKYAFAEIIFVMNG